jgi:hypothetical protein
VPVADYCREIEAYLCRKNDGHLIRVVGPSFDLVSSWAAQGVPLKIAFAGIDRYFERYYRQGPRRRPVRIDFCEADVLDVFDEWRRALGFPHSSVPSPQSSIEGRQPSVSLPEHLKRVVLKLASARTTGAGDPAWDEALNGAARELEVAREGARSMRGPARQMLIDRLAALDRDLLRTARVSLDEASRVALTREAQEELAGFRASMPPDAFARSLEAAIDRQVRERFKLPTITFS